MQPRRTISAERSSKRYSKNRLEATRIAGLRTRESNNGGKRTGSGLRLRRALAKSAEVYLRKARNHRQETDRQTGFDPPFITSGNVAAVRSGADSRFDMPNGLRVATDSKSETAGHEKELGVQARWQRQG